MVEAGPKTVGECDVMYTTLAVHPGAGRTGKPKSFDLGLASAMALPSLLDHSERRAGSGAIAFHPAFSELQQKSLSSCDVTRGSVIRRSTRDPDSLRWPRGTGK
jgi:hypothetical protein